jgi:Reverse transcriptase (RNA-dependent DNA polymerase)
MNEILKCSQFKKIEKFRKNGKLHPLKDDEYLSSLLLKLANNNHINKDVAKKLKPVGSQPAKLYGLPKVHKEGVPMRPVLSMIRTSQYEIAKFLDVMLKPLIPKGFGCLDSFEFVDFISKFDIKNNDEIMASFDVVSLFTNVPLKETIDLCCNLWRSNTTNHSILDEVAFRELLSFATSDVHFLFNNDWYKQVDGVAMGSPLAPTLASIFLSSIEDKIDSFVGRKPLAYKRYVDDIFLIFQNETDISPFLNYMNSLHSNVKFTMEKEQDKKLSFLDLLIERKNGRYETEIYRKKTDTGLYTTPISFCESKYRRNMIKGLIFRSWALSSTYKGCNDSLNKLNKLLYDNGYSKSIVEKLTKETIDKLIDKKVILKF